MLGCQGHYDGVIRRYRETHVSSWAVDQVDSSSLSTILGRLRELHPGDRPTQTHVLHLASDGEILPHIDNTEASGSWIMGVSLGDERVLCMTPVEGFASAEPFEIPLPSGSVYLQKSVIPLIARLMRISDELITETLFAIEPNIPYCPQVIRIETCQIRSDLVS